jgi:hypothetical protein
MNWVLVLHSVTVKHDMNNTKGSFHIVFPIVVEKEKKKKKKVILWTQIYHNIFHVLLR